MQKPVLFCNKVWHRDIRKNIHEGNQRHLIGQPYKHGGTFGSETFQRFHVVSQVLFQLLLT